MVERDYEPFSMMLDDVWGFYPQAKQPTAGQKAMFFRALSDHTIAAVRSGFDAHVRDPQRGRFPPLPSDVIAQIEGRIAQDMRPGPEEAWAIALQACDEAKTLVWTAEIAQAWGIARTVHAQGDEVGARMAFKDAYGRLIAKARADRTPVVWAPTIGHDAEQRDEALQRAHSAGLLPKPERLRELPAPDHAMSMRNTGMPAQVRERLQALRESIVNRQKVEPERCEEAMKKFSLIADEDLPPAMRRRAATPLSVNPFEGDVF